jgi:hypothetical protein
MVFVPAACWAAGLRPVAKRMFVCDGVPNFLFVHVGDGRRWFIPAGEVHACAGLLLGGPKYAAFEVARGLPIPV